MCMRAQCRFLCICMRARPAHRCVVVVIIQQTDLLSFSVSAAQSRVPLFCVFIFSIFPPRLHLLSLRENERSKGCRCRLFTHACLQLPDVKLLDQREARCHMYTFSSPSEYFQSLMTCFSFRAHSATRRSFPLDV